MGIDIWGYSRIRKLEEEPRVGTPYFHATFCDLAPPAYVAGLELSARYTYAKCHQSYAIHSTVLGDFGQCLWALEYLGDNEEARTRRFNFYMDWRNLPSDGVDHLWMQTWERLPFQELHSFLHSGTWMLNSTVCRRLAADFAGLHEEAKANLAKSPLFGAIYSDMCRAVQLAADDGVLVKLG